MIRKAHRFMGNCEPILRRLTKKLTPDQLRSCIPLEGKETTLFQAYPQQMVIARRQRRSTSTTP